MVKMSKKSKSQKRSKRRKLSKLLIKATVNKVRIPTCSGGFCFKSKKDYNRKNKKREIEVELNG